MTQFQWRKFAFFDKELLREPSNASTTRTASSSKLSISNANERLKDISISCSSAGKGFVLLGSTDGSVYVIDRSFAVDSFQAYTNDVSNMVQLKQSNILVTGGFDSLENAAYVKVWNRDRMDAIGQPILLRSLRAYPGKEVKPVRISALAVHENLTLMAVGFVDGTIVLVKGDVSKDSGSKIKTVDQRPHEEVTGLHFRPSSKEAILYMTTASKVWTYEIAQKNEKLNQIVNDKGCRPRCGVLSDSSQDYQLIVGCTDAIYFHQIDSRGQCLVFEGEKMMMLWHKNYLITVSKDNTFASSTNAPIGGLTAPRELFVVTVYDIHNKFIAFSGSIPEVKEVVCEWGSIFVIAGPNNHIFQLKEKDTQTKLDILFRKNQYDMAISLAKTQQYDKDGLVDIFRQYGDYLYNKGVYESAVTEYIKTIGRLEPSYVIRKFLDAHRIHNLTAYLQELHRRGAAKEEHTTLLLNCYTKLKDNDKLEEFINHENDVDFDVETAIRVCRQAQYFEHALKLAKKSGQHDWHVKILLEDLHKHEEALSYISGLDFESAKSIFITFGKQLVDSEPQATTVLLKKLCTDFGVDPMTGQRFRAEPDDFIKIYVMQPEYLIDFLEHMTASLNKLNRVVYNTLFELYLQAYSEAIDDKLKFDQDKEDSLESSLENSLPQMKIADPEKRVISLEQKAMALLRNKDADYDMDHALILCQLHKFRDGILYLYEKAQLYKQILKYHMDHREFEKVIEICKAHGETDPSLWRDALVFFGKHEANCHDQLKYVLGVIEEQELIPPLLVVQSLAQNTDVKVGTLKDFLSRKFQQQVARVSEDEKQIAAYKKEIESMRTQIHQLQTEPKRFQAIKCFRCTERLEMPSVHFYCDHSYHLHCFETYSENDECPECAEKNRKLMEILQSLQNKSELHQQFHNELSKATSDGFAVVARYFQHGVFD